MRKEFSLVFFVRTANGKKEIMMGKKNSPQKPKLHGTINGFGGGCEGNETILDCAIREVEEETTSKEGGSGVKLVKDDLILVGKIIDTSDGKNVEIFFVIWNENRFSKIPSSSNDFDDIKFFDIEKTDDFLPYMIRKNDILVEQLDLKLEELRDLGKIESDLFTIDETLNEDKELREQIQEIYKNR